MVTSGTKQPTLPAALTLGGLDLIVRDLTRSVDWYRRVLGLVPMGVGGGRAALGDGTSTVVTLHEDSDAPTDRRSAGLYHYALLFPSRVELARAAVRLVAMRQPIEGASDHRTHEAIYLRDPDDIGIELAADRPREMWPQDMGYSSGPAPLDVVDLLAGVQDEEPSETVGPGLTVGHVHLHVGDTGEATRFYRDALGFGVTADLGSAVFFAAGDYHHHVAANVWRGVGIGRQPSGVVGLRHWRVRMPTRDDVEELRDRLHAEGHGTDEHDDGFIIRDPWGIPLVVEPVG